MGDMAVEARSRGPELKEPGYEIFIAVLTILSLVNIVLVYAIDDPGLDAVLFAMNGLLSLIFLGDFVYRLISARSKSGYLFVRFGWADLLASLPFPELKLFRLFRLVRVSSLLRAYGTRNIIRSLVRDRAESALLTLVLLGILVLEFGSLEILHIEEHEPGANITSGSDALWYVVVTISTVGYGDHYPVSNPGRVFGALIIVLGVGIFGAFTGYLATVFLAPSRRSTSPGPAADAATPAADARTRTDELDALLARQRALTEEIERALRAPGP